MSRFPEFGPRCLSFVLVALVLLVGVNSLPAAEKEASQAKQSTALDGFVPENLEDLKVMQSHLQQLTQKVLPATVGVRVGPAQGSGVIIDKQGHVLTAAHVCGKPGRDVTFVFQDGTTKKGKTLGVNRSIDAGLMKITDEGDWMHVEMGDYDLVKPGQWVIATGHPGGFQKDRGVVLRLGRVLTKRNNLIATDCTLVGGDSGGPLFDMDGRVIGIHSRIGGSLTANVHVPVGTYHETWERLVAAEAWGGRLGSGGPFIGVIGDPDADGAKILEVQDDSPAAKAGIQPDDVIVQFAGKKVTSFAELATAVRSHKPGDKVKLKVSRGEETLELELKIGKRK